MSAHRTMRRRPRVASDCQQCGAPETAGPCPWSFTCPVCAAPPGELCMRPSREVCSMHRARVALADANLPPGLRDPLPGEQGQLTLSHG